MIWLAKSINEQLHIDKFYSFFEAKYDDSFTFHGESHNFWECLYVMKGSICVSGDERVYHLGEDEIIFHKPLEFHKFYVDCPEGAKLLIFSFSLEGAFSEHLRNMVFKLSEREKHIMELMLDYVRSKETSCKKENWYTEYLSPTENTPEYLQMLTTYIYQLFLTLANHGNVSKASTDFDALIYEKAISYMNSNICEQPSVSEIAAFCNISPTVLKQIFKKYSGIGVHKYFLNIKLKTAVSLLKDGMSVTEAALKLGFCSQAYFSAAFKRELGISPSEVDL